MKPRTAKSMELYDILLRRGYQEPFCDEITKNLNTDWTAQRMIQKADITLEDLRNANKVSLFNAMIEFGEIEIAIENVHIL